MINFHINDIEDYDAILLDVLFCDDIEVVEPTYA